ncbi:MAG: LptE family protein [Bacteroidetes bacterium]|nr:LptE family protein [Bacteroidota bacterium]
MKARFLYLVLILMPLINGCITYSFTGASISTDVKTVSVQFFKNNATLVQPTLSRTLTDALKDKFMSQTSLNLINKGGDLSFEGQITNYSTQPVAIQGNETAALNRLTITISVKFTNIKNDKQNFETSFSRYEDYPSSKNLVSVEEGLIKQITDVLVDDIFNRSVVNW